MDNSQLAGLKQTAKKLASAVGALESAAEGFNKYASPGAESWWKKKREELVEIEGTMLEILTDRQESRESGLSDGS